MGYRQDYENYYGVTLDANWHVHHIDYNHNNDNIENLVALPNYLHLELHKAHDTLEQYENDFQLSDIRLHSGLCCSHSDFMVALTNYVNVIDKCTTFMNMRDFSKMRVDNEQRF